MRSISSRVALLGIAGLIAVSAIVPASAATKHRRAAPAPVASSADVVRAADPSRLVGDPGRRLSAAERLLHRRRLRPLHVV